MRRALQIRNWKRLGVAGIVAFGAVQVAESRSFSADVGCASTKGSFAFYYSPRLTEEELSWLTRFNIVVTGSVLPEIQSRELKRSEAKLFLYHWLTGFYRENSPAKPHDRSWESFVYHSRPQWLLNPKRPDAGPDGRGSAYYYDPYHSDLRFAWAKRLAQATENSSYDGVFFDLVGNPALPEQLRQLYQERHPEMSYDQALSGFLRSLKRLGPDVLRFTNQGYRVPDAYLPLAEYDLSESLMTSYAWGEKVKIFVEGEGPVEKLETFYRSWEELKQIVDRATTDITQYNPKLKIFHLNYVNPRYVPTGRMEKIGGQEHAVFRKEIDRPAIYYGYAAAKLWGQESYSPSPEAMGFGQDEIYFVALGKPLGQSYEERDGLVRRYYEKGVAVVNPSEHRRVASLGSPFIPGEAKGLWDCYERKSVGGFTVAVEPTVSFTSARSYPAGRVYLYLSH